MGSSYTKPHKYFNYTDPIVKETLLLALDTWNKYATCPLIALLPTCSSSPSYNTLNPKQGWILISFPHSILQQFSSSTTQKNVNKPFIDVFFFVYILRDWNTVVFSLTHVFDVASVEILTQIKIVGRKRYF